MRLFFCILSNIDEKLRIIYEPFKTLFIKNKIIKTRKSLQRDSFLNYKTWENKMNV